MSQCLCYFIAVCATGVAFINSNVCNAVKSVENWWEYGGLGDTLFIPEQKKREIQQMYSDPEEQKKQLIHYWMSTDPLASWRRLITRLDHMSQSPVADAIRNFAEPLAAGTVRKVIVYNVHVYPFIHVHVQCHVWNAVVMCT